MVDAIVFAGATLFAFVCLFAGRMGPGLVARDSALLSGSAGVGVAYLFVDIMPHLASKQRVLLATTDGGLYGFLEHHAYLVALFGYCAFSLGAVLCMREDPGGEQVETAAPDSWATRLYIVVGGAGYFCLIAYMLAEQPDHRAEPVLLFAGAMAIHTVGLSHFLRNRLAATYERTDRFIFAGAAWAGWLLGVYIDVPDVAYALWFSLLAGGIFGLAAAELSVITSLRRLAHFVVGAGALSALLVLLEHYISLD